MPSTLNILGTGLLVLATSVSALTAQLTTTHQKARRSYTLEDSYDSTSLFGAFDFYTGNDPTHGYVNYQSQSAAQSQGLISTQNNQLYMGVDHRTVDPQSGRASVRVASKKSYTHGLFIADIAHMPGSICGVWPAFWLLGPDWPSHGEIDILEGVNMNSNNIITLHTVAGCDINTSGSQNGTVLAHTNCNQENANIGCGVATTTKNAYGDSFNAKGGGVYATQWTSSAIQVWFFPRGKIPADIKNGSPTVGSWGTPVVSFNGGSGCNLDSFINTQKIVFDTTFCGDWAGNPYVWAADAICSKKASQCTDYVSANPSAFEQAYWLINSVKVYQ